jgi:hypothetical protein
VRHLYTSGNVLIGLYYNSSKTHFEWMDGSEVIYTNWDTSANEPTNNPNEIYVHMKGTDKWQNCVAGCGSSLSGFICKTTSNLDTFFSEKAIGQPTALPSKLPSGYPSSQPSSQPTAQPSCQPTGRPSGIPSGEPSVQPTSQPTGHPTSQPTSQPSSQPSLQPSSKPSTRPSGEPSSQPTNIPTSRPSASQETEMEKSIDYAIQGLYHPIEKVSTEIITLAEIRGTSLSYSESVCKTWTDYLNTISASMTKYSGLKIELISQDGFMYNTPVHSWSCSNATLADEII